jgi:hypothetical protein
MDKTNDIQEKQIEPDTLVNIKEKFFGAVRRTLYIGMSYALGGWSQWEGEFYKITGVDRGEDPNKFPDGIKSLSMKEEFLEGGVSAAIGSVAMLQVIKYFCKREGKEITHKDEVLAIVVGGGLGYCGMSILGGIIHNIIGQPDVPTMEFINNFFK